ncbi:MAG: hypothetical protein KJ579_10005, partial [Verrucomicrobia bacterium]|nr:hypothetical protein [Verrucomicrobiota bacterium]
MQRAPAVLAATLLLTALRPAGAVDVALALQTRDARLEVGVDGRTILFADRATGTNHAAPKTSAFATVKKGGRVFAATSAAASGGTLALRFGDSGVSATLRVVAAARHFVVEVSEVAGEGIEELVFVNVPLALRAESGEPFAACALALNLQTNVRILPGASSHLWAACYPRFGFKGARVALIGCPQQELRQVLKDVVASAPDLPHSPIGGPWAMDSAENRGSYLFNRGVMTLETVDGWIALAKAFGITQIDFPGGEVFRYGDFLPNPKAYPKGWADFRAVVDRLHAAGLRAGLHTYAQFLSKATSWVTPVPDPRLGADAAFTLAADLPAGATVVTVVEPTGDMSVVVGGNVRNSVTLQVGDELIVYTEVGKTAPFSFSGCKRGAHGTRVAAHPAGAKVRHLKECFGLFVPDGDSTLLAEVAAKTAEAFNAGGFDMLYLDALDGSDIFAGPENAWHYQSKFVFEIWKRLARPAIAEMSTFSHHLWCVRSRMGAWDHPSRAHKPFIDAHVAGNRDNARMFLPSHLGWWALKTWTGPKGEPTFADDMEYLMARGLATDSGFSLMGVTPGTFDQMPAFARVAPILRAYETLRRADYFTADVKTALGVPGDEFSLFQDPSGEWQFRRMQYAPHKVEGLDGWSDRWTATNRFDRQPLQLRIEALVSAGPYDGPGPITVEDFDAARGPAETGAQKGVTGGWASSTAQVKVGVASGRFAATNASSSRRGAWIKAARRFDPLLDLKGREALGVWVHGDGKGETLNVQMQSPRQYHGGTADHYIVVDFTGWRYFELIEPDAWRFTDYVWPYGNPYAIYRESVNHAAVSSLALFYNNLPPGDAVTCYLSPIRALPTVETVWTNPAVTVGGRTLVFPVAMKSGSYLEFRSLADCKLYGL